MKVVIMESLGISEQELKECQKPFEEKGVVFESFAKTTDKEKLIEEAKDADAMILANMPMSADVLRACPNLKFIDIAFTGVETPPATPMRRSQSWYSAWFCPWRVICAKWKAGAEKVRLRTDWLAGNSRARPSASLAWAGSEAAQRSYSTLSGAIFWHRAGQSTRKYLPM